MGGRPFWRPGVGHDGARELRGAAAGDRAGGLGTGVAGRPALADDYRAAGALLVRPGWWHAAVSARPLPDLYLGDRRWRSVLWFPGPAGAARRRKGGLFSYGRAVRPQRR